jgi:hypothetical protein
MYMYMYMYIDADGKHTFGDFGLKLQGELLCEDAKLH